MNAAIIERDAAAGRARPAPAIPDLTLPQFVLGAAHGRGSKRALVDAATGHGLSYAELADAVRETGAGLSARGLRPGDVLALCAPNGIEFAVAWYAATAAGGSKPSNFSLSSNRREATILPSLSRIRADNPISAVGTESVAIRKRLTSIRS